MTLFLSFKSRVKQSLAKTTITEYALLLSILAFSVLFSIYGIQRYEYYRDGFEDFGQKIQFAWLVSQGHLTAYTLGRPILIVGGALFALYPNPVTLLVYQSSLLALGSLPLYLMAKRELSSRWYALLISVLYLVYPALSGVNTEYHDETFLVPFMIFAIYFYMTKKMKSYLISFLLALFSSEFAVVIGVFSALSFVLDYFESKSKVSIRFAIMTSCLILAWAVYLELTPFIPHFFLQTLPAGGYTLVGSSMLLNPVTILRNPIQSIAEFWPDKVQFLIYLFAPLLFLPLLCLRRLLPAFPWLAVVVGYSTELGQGGIGRVFQMWHVLTSFVIPFVFVSAIYGLKQFAEGAPDIQAATRRAKQILILMLVISVAVYSATGIFSPLSPVKVLSWGDTTAPIDAMCTDINANCQTGTPYHGVWPTPVSNYKKLNWFVAQIPDNYTVLTQNQIGSKLWQRAVPIYIFLQAGYNPVHLLSHQPDAILVDYNLAGLCVDCLNELLSTGNYTLFASYPQGSIYLYFQTSTSLGSQHLQVFSAPVASALKNRGERTTTCQVTPTCSY